MKRKSLLNKREKEKFLLKERKKKSYPHFSVKKKILLQTSPFLFLYKKIFSLQKKSSSALKRMLLIKRGKKISKIMVGISCDAAQLLTMHLDTWRHLIGRKLEAGDVATQIGGRVRAHGKCGAQDRCKERENSR